MVAGLVVVASFAVLATTRLPNPFVDDQGVDGPKSKEARAAAG